LTPEAEIVHRGRRTFVVEVTVLGGEHRRIAKLVAMQVAPAAPPATASPGPSGR
jgi:acyl-coenzyme A thioesterase PaaI-like protein